MVKYRGKATISTEMVKALLGLPEGVQLDSIVYEGNREVYKVLISTDEEMEGWTHATNPGQNPETISWDTHREERITQALRIVQNNFPEYQTNELYRDVLREEE